MQGTDVFSVLQNIGVTHLHHANSVTTSCTFLEQGGLLSRGFVEGRGLKQTPQPSSDEIDKRYGIWNRVFLDHVDIHDRGGKKKGPNQYGPVLFVLDLAVLCGLPAGSDVLVTKTNPVHWRDSDLDVVRWYQNAEELARDIKFGDFNKMLVIQTPSTRLDFPGRRADIILDDPQKQISSGKNAYAHAQTRLMSAAAVGGIQLSIAPRNCQVGCTCLQKYSTYNPQRIDFWFG